MKQIIKVLVYTISFFSWSKTFQQYTISTLINQHGHIRVIFLSAFFFFLDQKLEHYYILTLIVRFLLHR